ncbi:MAG: 6-carboxytetrahydropterin synthase [Pseudomonadota bacterium]
MAQLFVEDLTVLDFSFLDRERGLVGESWIVDIVLAGGLDEQGMVLDFGRVKKQIKHVIDEEADHRLLVPRYSPGCSVKLSDDDMTVDFELANGGTIRHQSPETAVLLVDSISVCTESVASYLRGKLRDVLPPSVSSVALALRAEEASGHYYHYSHGLQKHAGQCQRIAHGHRSRIEVEVNGVRNRDYEEQWAARLLDSYVATVEHLQERFELNGIPHSRLAYTATQGSFTLIVPSSCVFVIPGESTVENIAEFIAERISEQEVGEVSVRAFEGVGKGAIGFAGSKAAE